MLLALMLILDVLAQPAEMMQKAAVGKKPMRLAKTEPFIKCDTCALAVGQSFFIHEKISLFKVSLPQLKPGDLVAWVRNNRKNMGRYGEQMSLFLFFLDSLQLYIYVFQTFATKSCVRTSESAPGCKLPKRRRSFREESDVVYFFAFRFHSIWKKWWLIVKSDIYIYIFSWLKPTVFLFLTIFKFFKRRAHHFFFKDMRLTCDFRAKKLEEDLGKLRLVKC